MPEYRFYYLEQDGRVVCSRANPILDDDATAVAHAEKLIDGEAVEVWEGQRLAASVCFQSNPPDLTA